MLNQCFINLNIYKNIDATLEKKKEFLYKNK